MDTTKTITHVSFCAGYGGIDIGLKRVIPTLRTVAFSEIEAFACANLVAKMEAGLLDPAPIWSDLKTFPVEEFRDRVDILSGGYPCQPFSAAGKRLGADDPRHLWPYIANAIRAIRPKLCFFENVEGHITLGLSTVISDLEELGYTVSWGIFSAAECGAPHQRKRVFILAYNRNNSSGDQWTRSIHNYGNRKTTDFPFEGAHQSSRSSCKKNREQNASSNIGLSGGWSSKLAYSKGEGLERLDKLFAGCNEPRRQSSESQGSACGSDCSGDVWPSRPGQPQHAWEPPRVVGNAQSKRPTALRPKHEGQLRELCTASASSEGIVGDTAGERCQGNRRTDNSGWQINGLTEPDRSSADGKMESKQWQTQSTLGGDAHGFTDWMDHAELYTTCDNRTDELRLLGNGVVPSTAALAFKILFKEVNDSRPTAG